MSLRRRGALSFWVWGLLSLISLLVSFCGCASTTSDAARSTAEVPSHVYPGGREAVFAKALDAVLSMGWQVTFTDKTAGIISAKTPANLWTIGDNVSVRVQDGGNGGTLVDVSSGTSMQIVDWGRNKRNIDRYFKRLDSLFKRD